jgi:hypothetical protein
MVIAAQFCGHHGQDARLIVIGQRALTPCTPRPRFSAHIIAARRKRDGKFGTANVANGFQAVKIGDGLRG